MATSKKITELDALTTAAAADLMYIVDDPSGTPVSKKITVKSVLESNVASNVAFTGTMSIGANVTANVTTVAVGNSSVNSAISGGTVDVTNYVIANVVISEYTGTPADANSAPAAFANGAMWSDGSYLYVVTDSGSNEVKRVTLSTF